MPIFSLFCSPTYTGIQSRGNTLRFPQIEIFLSKRRLPSIHKLIILLGHLQLITLSQHKVPATGSQGELLQADHPLPMPWGVPSSFCHPSSLCKAMV